MSTGRPPADAPAGGRRASVVDGHVKPGALGRGESDSKRVSAEHNDPPTAPGATLGKPPVEGEGRRTADDARTAKP